MVPNKIHNSNNLTTHNRIATRSFSNNKQLYNNNHHYKCYRSNHNNKSIIKIRVTDINLIAFPQMKIKGISSIEYIYFINIFFAFYLHFRIHLKWIQIHIKILNFLSIHIHLCFQPFPHFDLYSLNLLSKIFCVCFKF